MTQTPDQAVLSLLPVLLIFILFSYFLIIRPQRKRHQSHLDTIKDLSIGDTILFSGGILAKIHQINDTTLDVVVSDDVIIQIQKYSVSQVIKQQN